MAAERTRGTWTDERLDDLAGRMDRGFDRIDAEMRALRTDLGARIDGLDGRIDERTDSLSARIDSLQRTMFACVVTFAVGFAGLILTQI